MTKIAIGKDENGAEVLRRAGIPTPGWCGGSGACGLCKLLIVGATIPIPTSSDKKHLSREEITSGWRLACTLEPGEYEIDTSPVLSEYSHHTVPPETLIDPSFWPCRLGPGLALDLGTTTVMATVFDEYGGPGPVCITSNLQSVFGDDVLSRLSAAFESTGAETLRQLAFKSLSMVATAAVETVERSMIPKWTGIVGNTAMHHLLAGLEVSSLSLSPFSPAHGAYDWIEIPTMDTVSGEVSPLLVPPLGGFVGSDTISSISVLLKALPGRSWILVDIGTNCEIVLHQAGRFSYISAPAGPAFEGRGLSSGMPAMTGAVATISMNHGIFDWSVIGGGEPLGLCGSSAIDFLGILVESGEVDESGRMTGSVKRVSLDESGKIWLTQRDIRELQKAKGAVELCLRAVLEETGMDIHQVDHFVIAGGFGRALNLKNATKIGLLPRIAENRFLNAGNLALLGVGLAMDKEAVGWIRRRSTRIILQDRKFMGRFTEALKLRPWRS